MSKQCEGWRRTGGAFSFGPVRWDQCENEAVVTITVIQEGKQEEPMPACMTCWQECESTSDITVLRAEPLAKADKG